MKYRTIIFMLCVLISFGLSSCFNEYEYQGDYPALQTMAVNNILGVSGGYSDVIDITETDMQGRTLFYFESSAIIKYHSDSMKFGNISAYLIAQYFDEDYVYFYPDYNFIMASTVEELTDEKISELKNKNDWGLEINRDKCIKKKIQTVKPDFDPWTVASVPKSILEKAYGIINQDSIYDYYTAIYLTSDSYGRHIYMFAVCTKGDSDWNNGERDVYVVIFDLLGKVENEIDILKLEDCYNYQDELKAFKEENGWEVPRE